MSTAGPLSTRKGDSSFADPEYRSFDDVFTAFDRTRPTTKSYLILDEFKWSNQPIGLDVGSTLRQKVETLWPDRAAQIRLALFSPRGFTEALDTWASANGAWLVSAEEVVGA
jgi:hypothetical protein